MPARAQADPRPVSDKLFQQNCIRTCITYLAAHSYEFPITPKVRRAWWARRRGAGRLRGRPLWRWLSGVRIAPAGGGITGQEKRADLHSTTSSKSVSTHRGACPLRPAGAGEPHDQGLCQHHALPLPPGRPQPQRQDLWWVLACRAAAQLALLCAGRSRGTGRRSVRAQPGGGRSLRRGGKSGPAACLLLQARSRRRCRSSSSASSTPSRSARATSRR